MTPEEHNSWLARAHVGYAVLNVLLIAATIAWVFGGALGRDDLIFTTIVAIFSLINLGLTGPSLVAAWALRKRKRWAKTAAIVAAAVATMFFPFGIAVAIYTFWFLFGGPARALYDPMSADSSRTLSAGTINGVSATDHAKFEKQFTPNWR
jgi:uncharacterized membrane protein YozB (DUF420 family)